MNYQVVLFALVLCATLYSQASGAGVTQCHHCYDFNECADEVQDCPAGDTVFACISAVVEQGGNVQYIKGCTYTDSAAVGVCTAIDSADGGSCTICDTDLCNA